MLPDADDPRADSPGSAAPTATHSGVPFPSETADFPPAPVPFTDLTAHAHGGLGDVFRATDPELNRTVALKRLQGRHAGKDDTRRRFLIEAEVTARLEHPGVVPVYGLYPGGDQPAYAMRFVEGQTLAEAIAETMAGPPDPAAFRRLVHAFHQVCQTVAYAHSRGVIHRDLKPSNVMLGQFGETLVVDWGLAKVVGRSEEVRATGTTETLVPSGVESGADETAMGSAIGTPAYMSPEQAAGRWDVVAQLSDVYGLGAVLYTVLTGRPPLEKGNWPEQQQRIQRGDFPRPRQINPAAPRALEAVCLKAMALNPADRYPSAGAVAADVERWLAGEPVTAYPEPFPARARRWANRNRSLVGATAVLLVAAVVGLSAGAVLLNRARVETDTQRKAAETAQRRAEAINRFLIDDLLKQADPENSPVGDKITVRELLDKAAARLDASAELADQPEVEAELRTAIGQAYDNLGLMETAAKHYDRGRKLRESVLGPDHLETLTLRNKYVWTMVSQGGDPAAAERLARDSLADCTRALGDEHVETTQAADNLAQLLMDHGRYDEAEGLFRRNYDLLSATAGLTHPRTREAFNNYAVLLALRNRPAEAEAVFRRLLQAEVESAGPRCPGAVRARADIAGVTVAQGHFARAEPLLRDVLPDLKAIVGSNHARVFKVRNNLGYALEGQEKHAEAEQEYLAVLKDRRAALSPTHPDTRRTLAFLARLYARQQRWPEAAPYLAELLVLEHPDRKREIGALATTLVAALNGTGDTTTAVLLLGETVEVLRVRLWSGDWLTADVQSRYGDHLRRQGKFDDAKEALIPAANGLRTAIGVPAWTSPAARARVAALYQDWNMPGDAAQWK